MKEQFVPYDMALKLKELCFNEPCFCFYTYKKEIRRYTNFDGDLNQLQSLKNSSITVSDEWCTAPLWQQVIDWLRDKHSLDVIISSNLLGYGFIIYNRYPPKNILDNRVFQTYFEAREQAILKALELIK